MPSFFSKTATSEDIRRQLAEEQRRLEENGGRQAAHRAEETALLEEGDRAAISAFRKRTANLLQELNDDGAISAARIRRLEAELVEVLEREATVVRQAVVDRLAAAIKALSPLCAKWSQEAEALTKTVSTVEDLYAQADQARAELERFDEQDKATGKVAGPSWVQRGDEVCESPFLHERDASGNKPERPRYADLEVCDAFGRPLWSKRRGAL